MSELSSLTQSVIDTLTEFKGQQIVELDVRQTSSVAETMIVCSATSNRHASTLADRVWIASKQLGIQPIGREGNDGNEWVLLDFGDLIVHIMLPAVREHYDLESLWCHSPSDNSDHEA